MRAILITAIVTWSGLFGGISPAHERPVHEDIAVAAALSSQGLPSFLQDSLGPQGGANPFYASPRLRLTLGVTLPQGDVFRMESGDWRSPFGPIEWIRWGSKFEDRHRNVRGCNHFYNALTKAPLTDPAESAKRVSGTNVNSLTWATTAGLREPYVPLLTPSEQNMMKWSDIRAYQYGALTNAGRTDRLASLALALYGLGHVVHLNQDLSEPEHVRNDAHKSRDAIESYGEKTYVAQARKQVPAGDLRRLFPLRPRGWSSWRADGFQKLEDFWNRGKYTGQVQALIDDARSKPGGQLGLAEFSNGNFLGEDALYAESLLNAPDRAFHYFPLPSLVKSTTFPQVRRTVLKGVGVVLLDNKTNVNRVYLHKYPTSGLGVTNHSALTYEGVKAREKPVKISSTIADNNVLWSYHTNLIPKAIEYSAGILDYFFRGQIGITAHRASSHWLQLAVQNNSGQPSRGQNDLFYLFSVPGSW